MGFRLRVIDTERKFSRALSLDAIARPVPWGDIQAVVAAHGPPQCRDRKLNAALTVLLVIAMHLYTHLSLGHVLRQLAVGLRYIWPDARYVVAGDAAISYRRYQLGPRPLMALFRRVCRPMATP